jgi:tetratricopeptide (TPR) repeat protein
MLGAAHYGLSQLTESEAHSIKSMLISGWRVPETRGQKVTFLLSQIGQQVLHREFPSQYFGRNSYQRDELMLAARNCQQLSTMRYLIGDSLSTLLFTFYALNLDEKAGVSAQLARSYVNVGFAISLIPLHKQARSYIQRALDIADKVNAQETATQAYCWIKTVSGLYHTGIGEWSRAEADLVHAERINLKLGDSRGFFPIYALLGFINFYLGNYERYMEFGQRLADIGFKSNDPQSVINGLHSKVISQARLAQFEQAAALNDEIKRLPEYERVAEVNRIGIGCVECGILWYRGESDKSMQRFLEFSEAFFKMRPTSVSTLVSYQFIVPALLGMWEAGNVSARELVYRVCKSLRRVYKVFKVIQPETLRYEGLCDWLDGKTAQAMQKWAKSLARAQELKSPFEQANSYYEMGRHLPAGDARRKEYLAQALTLYQQIGATYHVEMVRRA